MKAQTQSLALPLQSYKTYVWAAVFVAGNIVLPQLCHTVGLGGKAFLPILFFTLIAAARYGWACGLLTAIASPLINHLLFGMPAADMLAVILVKSVVLAAVVGIAMYKTGKLSLVNGLIAIAAYQLAGMGLFAALTGSWSAAWADVTVSWPAMLIQIVAVLALLQLRARQKA